MSDNDKIKSITDRIKRIAKDTKAPFPAVVTDFLIERIVFRLARDPILKDHMIFKGGYVGLKCYNSPRYTVDLDAIAHKKPIEKIIEKTKLAIESDYGDFVWFELEKEIDLSTQSQLPPPKGGASGLTDS